jgi:hypothetical protein
MNSKSYYIIIACLFLNLHVTAQLKKDSTLPIDHTGPSANSLFSSDSILVLKIRGDIRSLLNDRSGEPKYFPMSLFYKNGDNAEISVPVNIKTRGHFRRLKENCFYPPLLLQFSGDSKTEAGIFPSKAKLKLVMPCAEDEYVVREWLVYKIYNLITPESFKTRLVKVTLENEKNNSTTKPFIGIIIEEEKQMAKRNGLVVVNRKTKPQKTEEEVFLKLTVFEYLIGNTDWSVEYLQNIKLIATDSISVPHTVPYDFDHAGIVSAPYALPFEALQMTSVRERRYRGYCITDLKKFEPVVAQFNNLKNDIYNLYTNCPLLGQSYVKTTIKYLDEFYKTINDPKLLQKEFQYPCDKNGTGNVIIKGLKDN